MKQVFLDDFKLQDPDDATLGFVLSRPIQGLDFPAVRMASTERSGADGVNVSNSFYGERRIGIEGTIYGFDTDATYEAQRRALITALAVEKDANGFLIPKVLRFITNDNLDLRAVVFIASRPEIRRSTLLTGDFYIDLLAENSLIESFAETVVIVNTRSLGGLTIPEKLPWIFAGGSGGDTTVTNNGNSIAYPVITLYGPLTSPRLTNLTTGEAIALSLTIDSGSSVVIDMYNRTVIQGGITNRVPNMTSDSVFWGLLAGANELSLSSAISGEAGYAEVRFRNSYLGV